MMKRFAPEEIAEAAEVLKQDGCIAAATDTVYGICARISQRAMERLYEVKHRPSSKQFPIMCRDLEQLKEIAEVNPQAEAVIRALMPGPLTVILKRREAFPDYAGGNTLAIRLAMNDQLRKLICLTGTPLFMTSANRSGMPECRTPEAIEAACPLLDGILEGEVHYNQASTIADLTTETPRILREGPITLDELQRALMGGQK